MISKQKIIDEILLQLEREHQTLAQAALDAKDAATNEESKAENKYDTRGLEASYLAGAQSKRAEELQRIILSFQKINIRNYGKDDLVESTALVQVSIDDEEKRWFFLVPMSGGMKLQIENLQIMTLSPDSPLGKKIYKTKLGDAFEVVLKGESKEYEVIEVY